MASILSSPSSRGKVSFDREFRRPRPWRVCAAALLLAPSTGLGAGEHPSASVAAVLSERAAPVAEEPVWTLATGRRLILFPVGDLYPEYVADPHRRAFAVSLRRYTRTDIPETGPERFNVKFGARIGVLRGVAPKSPRWDWQLNLEVGFDAQFDNEHAQDNIGWDGHYGALLTLTPAPQWAVKAGLMHVSSHVGDEYMQRTGRQRIEYTREEAVLGGMHELGIWQLYAEAGWAYVLRNPALQEPWRAQIGAQFQSRTGPWGGRLRWYGGLDLSATQERGWRVDAALQAGLVLRAGGRPWRLGVEYYDGRPSIGEFFQFTERHMAIGLWLDV
jgi:hypothetical protein